MGWRLRLSRRRRHQDTRETGSLRNGQPWLRVADQMFWGVVPKLPCLTSRGRPGQQGSR